MDPVWSSVLQWTAGGFYLLNKLFFWLSEKARGHNRLAQARKLRITSWSVYILGMPSWIAIFIANRNWIAMALELAGLPAMALGLITACRGLRKGSPRWLNFLALAAVMLGLGYSLYDFDGLREFTQWLELGLVSGFLVGTYMLAKDKSVGYMWYVLMHVCCGWLMWAQGFIWLTAQQAVSMGLVVAAYTSARKRSH